MPLSYARHGGINMFGWKIFRKKRIIPCAKNTYFILVNLEVKHKALKIAGILDVVLTVETERYNHMV